MESRFDLLAKEWDSKPQRVESAMKFVDYVKQNTKTNLDDFKVLDYGCGSGLVSFGFADDVKYIDGFDYSKEMICRYNEKSKELNYTNVKGVIHNINEEDISSSGYNLVVTNMTMHHIKDINRFVQVLKNSLDKDGYLYIADLVTEDGTFHSMGNDDVEHLGFDKEFLLNVFKENDFVDIKYGIIQTIYKENKSYRIFSISGKRI